MKSRAALLFEVPGKWEVVEVDVDEPRENEVLLRNVAAGLCHSDEHHATGDVGQDRLPYCGGHEGASIVEAVGPGVTLVKPGDHVVTAFIPGCGRCRPCTEGRQNLCDNGAYMATGAMLDGTFRMHHEGRDVAQACFVATFSQYSVVPERCCVRIDDDIPLQSAALLGCGVATGWGSAVHAGQVSPGDVVIVMGAGGLGTAAVQGAKHAGASRIIAAEPLPFRRSSVLSFGATDAVETMEEAVDLARSSTNGQGADVAIITTSLLRGEYVAQAFDGVRKAGTVVVTAVPGRDPGPTPLALTGFPYFQKRIQGCLYGAMSPARAVPLLLDLYRAGQLKLDEMVTRTFPLDEINDGWAAMYAGTTVRGVVTHDA